MGSKTKQKEPSPPPKKPVLYLHFKKSKNYLWKRYVNF